MKKNKTIKTRDLTNPQGFTLVELIVVVVVLGIIAALAIGTFQTVRSSSVENIALRSAEQIVRNAEGIGSFQGEELAGDAGDTNIDLAGSEIDTTNGASYDAAGGQSYAGKLTINTNGECAEATIEKNGDISVAACGEVSASPYWLYDQTLGAIPDSTVAINSGVSYGQLLTAPSNGVFSEIQIYINKGPIDVTAELYEVTGGTSASYSTSLVTSQVFSGINSNGQVSVDTPGFTAENGKQYIVSVKINTNQENVSLYNSGDVTAYSSSNGSTFSQLGGNLEMRIEYTAG